MSRVAVQVDSTPRHVELLPFASESGLQRFVEAHAKGLFGVQIVASALSRGRRVLDLDILALDQDGAPWIIECKHDLVDAHAVEQLLRYRGQLVAQWRAIRERLATWHVSVPQAPTDPILVLIGYRYERIFDDQRMLCLAYRYDDIEFTDERLQEQKSGTVSVHRADRIHLPAVSHPKVSKKDSTERRLQRLAPALADSFWRLDAELCHLTGVKVTYGGKNFVRYRTRAGTFAEAVVGEGQIEWRTTGSAPAAHLRSDADGPEVSKILRDAYQRGRDERK